jgi:hypothetical protein
MKRQLPFLVGTLVTLLVAASSGALTAGTTPVAALQPEPHFGYAERLVTRLLATSHYARRPLDDTLSGELFERYLEALDGTRSYFTAADISQLRGQYGTTLDDALARNDVRPPCASSINARISRSWRPTASTGRECLGLLMPPRSTSFGASASRTISSV